MSKRKVYFEEDNKIVKALIIADSFDEFFRPITLETPRVFFFLFDTLYITISKKQHYNF